MGTRFRAGFTVGRDDLNPLFPPPPPHDCRPLTAPHSPSPPRPQRRSGPAPSPALSASGWPIAVPPTPHGQSRRGAVAMATQDAVRPSHGLLQGGSADRKLAGGGVRAAGTATPAPACPRRPKSALNARLWVLDNTSAPLSFANRSSWGILSGREIKDNF